MITTSRKRTLAIYAFTLVAGYALFIAPNLFFGIFKVDGGLTGLNLAWIGLFQLVTVSLLVFWALRALGGTFRDIGWDFGHWRRDMTVGGALGLAWVLVECLILIPAQGGTKEPNVAQIIERIDGNGASIVGYLILGIVGGGITEEIFNRGFTINVLRSVFADPRVGLWVSAFLSIVLFMIGHMPVTAFDWLTILVPTLIYTGLFVWSGRLAAPIAAHAMHNGVALALIYFQYIA